MPFAEIFQPRHQPLHGDRWRHGNGQNRCVGQRIQVVHRAGQGTKRILDPQQQNSAGLAELQGLAGAMEQRNADPVLQIPYLVADGGRRYVQFIRGTAEIKVPRGCLEGPQCIQGR